MKILHETKNMYVNEKLEICWNVAVGALLVGKAKDLASAIRFCERAERYPDNFRKMLQAA